MKSFLVIFAVAALCLSVQGRPEPRAKQFHDHFLDFELLIIEEVGQELESLAEQYLQFDDFLVTVDYLQTTNFRDVILEMESLPEFVAVVKFLEQHDIDILFFIDILNESFDTLSRVKRSTTRQNVSGTNFVSYTNDVIATFPKDKLAALYNEKIVEDEVFKAAMDSLYSDEWNEIYGALWDSPIFQKEVDTLAEYGIDVTMVIKQMQAVLGQ